MGDKEYLLPLSPEPENTELPQHPHERRHANIAIAIASVAVIVALSQTYEAHKSRLEARNSAEQQAKDVERSRKATEESARAATKGSDAAWNSVGQFAAMVALSKAQLSTWEQLVTAQEAPSVTLDSPSLIGF